MTENYNDYDSNSNPNAFGQNGDAAAMADYLVESLRDSGAYPLSDARGRYRTAALTAPAPSPSSPTELRRAGGRWRGYEPRQRGRVWTIPLSGDYADWINLFIIPGYMATDDKYARLDALASADMLILPSPERGLPCVKRYLAAEEDTIRRMPRERLERLLRSYPNSQNRR